jgi:hypothetical protein
MAHPPAWPSGDEPKAAHAQRHRWRCLEARAHAEAQAMIAKHRAAQQSKGFADFVNSNKTLVIVAIIVLVSILWVVL